MSDYTIKNLDVSTRIDACTDSESSRYALGSVRMVRKSETTALLCATDGRALAVTHATAAHIDDSVNVAAIPAKIIPKRANSSRRIYRRLSLNGRWETPDGKFCEAENEPARFPNVSDILPELGITTIENAISINVDILRNLADAITEAGSEKHVTLFIKDPESAIAVVGSHGAGVVMPLTQNDKITADVKKYNEIRNEVKQTEFNT